MASLLTRRQPQQEIPAWWREDEPDSVARALYDTVAHLEEISSDRREDDRLHMALYGNRDIAGLGYDLRWTEREQDRLRFNLCAMAVDTVASKFAKIKPKATVLTDRADWSMRKRAEAFEQAIEGEYYRSNVYQLAPQMAADGMITGDGYLKVCPHEGYPRIERVWPGEILVDPIESAYNAPRTMYQVKMIDREAVLAMFSDEDGEIDDKIEKAILDAPVANSKFFPWLSNDTLIQPILVVEGWHLPSGSNASDGRHVIAVQDAVLTDKDDWNWTRQRFPFARFTWKRRQVGYYGKGIVEELRPDQRELNYVLQKIQDITHLGSTFRMLVEGDSRVNVEQLDNMPGAVLRYHGVIPPQPQVVNAIPQELLTWADTIIDRAMQKVGVSMLAAASEKPAGLNSGEALRRFSDIESERFQVAQQAYEQTIGVDLAQLVIDEKKAIAEAGDEVPVQARVRRRRALTLKTIKWDDVDMDDDRYQLKVFPTSALPSTPAGRTATVEQWIGAGFITREQGMQLLDFPDLDGFLADELAPFDIVLDAIEQMVEEGDYVPPEPVQNFELSKDLVSKAYQRHRYEGVPESHLDLLLRYLDDIDAMQQAAMPPPPQQVTPQMGPAAPSPQGLLPPQPAALPAA